MMPRSMACLWVVFALAIIASVVVEGAFNELKFNELVAHVEQDARDFARQVEEMYKERCVATTYTSCERTNYDECQTQYPNPQCLGGPNYFLPYCAFGEEGGNSTDHKYVANHSCSGLYDFTVSTVRIPAAEAISGRNEALFEAICSTRGIDVWLQTRKHRDKDYWQDLGIEPRAWYFGSTTGAFRIWPGRHRDQCGAYDPRERPWYVGGGSGVKNVVLIIDTSGSMGSNGDRLNVAKEAARRIVKTLNGADRVTIISFNETARAITDENGWMLRATTENKEFLLNQIDALEASGSTNFADAFQTAFDIFDATLDAEREVSCNSAILFLTDGENKAEFGFTLPEITDMVQNRTETIRFRMGKPVILFTYSISENSNVHQYPSELACAVEKGVWTKITDSREIVESLSSYYRLFSLGLGVDANKDFVAWSEPYRFATGNVLGTTVSVPVYDRSRNPHFFLGVVGVDFSMEAIDNALGGNSAEQARTESINRIIRASDASCPPELDLTKCELQAWSHIFDPEEPLQCNVTCTGSDAVDVAFQQCNVSMPYPHNLFANNELEDVPYDQRVCCLVGTNKPSDTCPVRVENTSVVSKTEEEESSDSSGGLSSTAKIAIAVPIAIAGFLFLGGLALFFLLRKPEPDDRNGEPEWAKPPTVCPPPPVNPHLAAIARAPSSRSSSPAPLDLEEAGISGINNESVARIPPDHPGSGSLSGPQPAPFLPAETGVSNSLEQQHIAESGSSNADQRRMPSFQAETGVPDDEPGA